MASPGGFSGTYLFQPSLGELTLYALGLCGVRRAAILQEHMQDARIAANLVLIDWLNQGIDLWQVELITVPLVQGQGTYNVPTNVLAMLDAYISYGSPSIDRIILPVSRSEYASYPNKAQQGFPTVFWMDRILSPTFTIWPTPDGNEASMSYYAIRQSQDANFTSGQQVELPYAWLNAFATGLAEKLALSWAPDRLVALSAAASKAYGIAANANVEQAAQYISPMLSGYFRN